MKYTPNKNSKGYKTLNGTSSGRDFLHKLGKDSELSDDVKKAFFEYLETFDGVSSGDILEFCSEWFFKNTLGGSAYKGGRSNVFIRIKDVERFEGWLKKIVPERSVGNTLKRLLDPFVDETHRARAFRAILEMGIRKNILRYSKQTEFYLGVSGLPDSVRPLVKEARTGPGIEWSIPWPIDEPDLLSDKKLEWLDCRAGLSANKDMNKIVYKHDISSRKKVCRPTVFDAGFYPQFQLGGKTIPLAECKDMNGFEEYVHDPNLFKYIEGIPAIIVK